VSDIDVIDMLRGKLINEALVNSTPGVSRAAVLVPFMRDPGPTLVFTRRSDDLTHHRGEISFPGGRADDDEHAMQAALREANEELGIVPDHVEILGRLPAVLTVVSGYEIEPWVGVIPRTEFKPNPREVAEVLEVPVDVLLEPGTRRLQKFIRDGHMYTNPAFDVGPNIIWGATARILSLLIAIIEGEA
jgi:8-oxo-dGTP pyrophosphatase MutT (NUDIX family)